MSMQRKTRRVIVAIAVIALLAAGGVVFTSQIDGQLNGQTANIGFGSELVRGATAQAINYKLDENGQYIEAVDVNLVGDYTGTTTSPWVFTGSVTNNSGQPLVWRDNGSGTWGWFATVPEGGGSGYPVTSGNCAIDATFGGVGGDGAGFDHTDGPNGSTRISCDFAGGPGGADGVPVTSVAGFQLSVTGNNSDAGTSESLGTTEPNSKTTVEPTPHP